MWSLPHQAWSRPEGPVPPSRRPPAPLPGEGPCPRKAHRGDALTCRRAGPGRAGPRPQGCRRRGRCVAPVTTPTGAAIFPPRPPAAAPAPPAPNCAGAGPPQHHVMWAGIACMLWLRHDGKVKSSRRGAVWGPPCWMVLPPCWERRDGEAAMLGRSALRRRCQGESRSFSLFLPVPSRFLTLIHSPGGTAGARGSALPAVVPLSACCSPAVSLQIPQRPGASEGLAGRRDVTRSWRAVMPLFPWR